MSVSIWEDSIAKKYDKLYIDIDTEVLVIGGGLCGILCAYRLAKAGKKVVLVEQKRIGSGKTRRTTACITALQDVMYKDLIKKIGKDNARLFLESNLMAIDEYERLSSKYEFDFERVSSYKYSLDDVDILIDEINAIKELGYEAFLCKNINLPIRIKAAIEMKNQGQMNPLKLINSLKEEIEIYENTKIVKLDAHTAYTEDGHKIYTQNIVMCTGYPFLKLRGFLFVKQYQEKSYVMAAKVDKKLKGNAVGINKSDLYFRDYGDYLIVGGSQVRTGIEIDGFDPIKDYMALNTQNSIEFSWINQDCVTLDEMPYIGRYGYLEDTYVATGFNLWGMTGSMISSIIICDYILKKHNKYYKLFDPNRKIMLTRTIKNVGSAVKGLLTPKLKRCTHLGCALNWIEKDQVYECGCHGSRYDKNGNVIDGPALKKINVKYD